MDTNFKSNLAMVVSNHPLSFKLIRQSIFKLESGNQNILDERTPKTGKQNDPILKATKP